MKMDRPSQETRQHRQQASAHLQELQRGRLSWVHYADEMNFQ
jgi:hypothetical protein